MNIMNKHSTKCYVDKNEETANNSNNSNKSSETDLNKITEINKYFNLPIHYNKEKVVLKKNIISDLELINTLDESCNPIYTFCFDNDNDVSKILNEQIAKYYTTDVSFLKDNQQLLKEYKTLGKKYTDYSPNYKKITEIWNELKVDSGFKEKYYYIEWGFLEFLNRSEGFLQFISMYNLCSPLFSLLVPIIILILPFFIIKMKGLHLTVNEYIDVLKIVAQTNAFGKLFTVNFKEITSQERIYILVSAAFYLFSIYQNVMICVRYNKNMETIHNHFRELKEYTNYTIDEMENYLLFSETLDTHSEFSNVLREKVGNLKNINRKLSEISDYKVSNIRKVGEVGKVLKYFYELHSDHLYDEVIMYSLGFNGYIECIKGLQNNIVERKLGFASFISDKKKTVVKNNYYACLKNGNPIKNSIELKKNIIITGPNASGKTTILKSLLINIILTQQFGCGFYDYAKIAPVKHIHCYLNIPDTSGRDSLFQAEARRCKEILDLIEENSDESHFCAFDELYSGTNPEEAEISATSFMNYIVKRKNLRCILTTHFIKVCKKLSKTPEILNCKMVTEEKAGKLWYKYKLEKGISNIKGGIHVLKTLNYPSEIIDGAK